MICLLSHLASKRRLSSCCPWESHSRRLHLLLPPMAPKPIASPVPIQWYPVLSALLLFVGLLVSAFFFIYEATSSTRNRSLAKELVAAVVASTLLGFGSLFLLLATGVYV